MVTARPLSSVRLYAIVSPSQSHQAICLGYCLTMDEGQLYCIVLAPLLIILGVVYIRPRNREQKHPPGPRGLPIVGNAFQLPAKVSYRFMISCPAEA